MICKSLVGSKSSLSLATDDLKIKPCKWEWQGFPGGFIGKEPARQCRRHEKCRFDSWLGKIHWRRAWQPTPVFLPGEFHGQRSLAGYSLWGHRVGHNWSNLAQWEWQRLRRIFLRISKGGGRQTVKYNAAAAKSLQSCPTLCDPIDGSPPGSPVPGILQARTLEWVAISFSNAWKWKVQVVFDS